MYKSNFKLILSLLLVLTLIGSLISCRKKNTQVEFSGKVINPANNQAVADAAVSLASTSVQSWVYNSNFQDIANGISSDDGIFSFLFNDQAASAYRIYIYKSNYFSNTTLINANDVSSERKYNADFDLFSEATVVLHISNTNPQDNSDRILYKILSVTQACSNCCPTNYIEGLGNNYDTIINCTTYGNMYFIVESNITKGLNTVIRRDSVYMTPFQTTEIEIFY